MSNGDDALIEDLVILAARLQSGTDVTPIRLIAEIRTRRPDLPLVSISQLIDDLENRSLGRIKPPQDEPGEREFSIDFRGVEFARRVSEDRRPKSISEKLSQWNRSDWIAFGAFIISIVALVK